MDINELKHQARKKGKWTIHLSGGHVLECRYHQEAWHHAYTFCHDHLEVGEEEAAHLLDRQFRLTELMP